MMQMGLWNIFAAIYTNEDTLEPAIFLFMFSQVSWLSTGEPLAPSPFRGDTPPPIHITGPV